MPYDPTLYIDTAEYYLSGRPPYSGSMIRTLLNTAGLDGYGRFLDIGCGPGILTIPFAENFDEAIGLDPDAGMLAAAETRSKQIGVQNITWVLALAEEIETLKLGEFRLVTFGQSFHWMDVHHVARLVYNILEPDGAIAIVNHEVDGRPKPPGPGYPPIPHEIIRRRITQYLGPRRRAGQGFASVPTEPFEGVLVRAGFETPLHLYCEGQSDIVQTIDGVLANYLSTSFAAPHLFGDRLETFMADVRSDLLSVSHEAKFWDWPGDTHIILATKPGQRKSGTGRPDRSDPTNNC